ncbi:hypothetical protein PTKIN_Ptkin01aG0278100 [Pterospermum kingtungense]
MLRKMQCMSLLTIRRSDVEKFKPLLKEGALYQISRYGDERIEVLICHLDDAGDESRHTKEDNPEIKEVMIAKLLTFKPETIHNLRFSCQARVIDVDPSTGWFYNGCNQCLKSVCLHSEEFYCAEHGQQASKLIIKLNMIIQDQTGQMELLAFAKQAEKLINSSISNIAANETLDKMTLPNPVTEIIDKYFIFEIGLTQQAKKNNTLGYKIFDSEICLNKLTAQYTLPMNQNEVGTSTQLPPLVQQPHEVTEEGHEHSPISLPPKMFLKMFSRKNLQQRSQGSFDMAQDLPQTLAQLPGIPCGLFSEFWLLSCTPIARFSRPGCIILEELATVIRSLPRKKSFLNLMAKK